ncbi:DUF1836 domain-containing protein [Bacillaceae bacterium Marseille-Q3522]|nr:DUF1836 domain-containing protein [Bacillaceae bacterium Marseille-Q3522]
MSEIEKILSALQLEKNIRLEDIPSIDLYMDQVIQLFEAKFHHSTRNSQEKVLTKTMINNYAKGKLFIPIKNKKYSKEHLILISLIYQLKGALSMHDIKETLAGINNRIETGNFSLDAFYKSYEHIFNDNVEHFQGDVLAQEKNIREEVTRLNEEHSEDLEQILLIASLVQLSNFYRRIAEKLVDGMVERREEK